MSRGIDSTVTSDIETERHVRLITFVKLEFDSGTVYLHDSIGTITWADPDDGSQDWLGVGDLGGVGSIEENKELSAYEITLTLSALDSDLLDEALNQPYQGRAVTIYLGAFDLTSGAGLLATPDEIWAGKMDVARVTVGAADENAIEITCESDFAKLDLINGRTFTDSDLQAEYAGDTFLQYVATMADATVVWRGRNSNSYGGPGIQNPGDPRYGPWFV